MAGADVAAAFPHIDLGQAALSAVRRRVTCGRFAFRMSRQHWHCVGSSKGRPAPAVSQSVGGEDRRDDGDRSGSGLQR